MSSSKPVSFIVVVVEAFMRSIIYWLLVAALIIWTIFTGYSFFGKTNGLGLSLISFGIVWAVAGIPLSLLALVFKPR